MEGPWQLSLISDDLVRVPSINGTWAWEKSQEAKNLITKETVILMYYDMLIPSTGAGWVSNTYIVYDSRNSFEQAGCTANYTGSCTWNPSSVYRLNSPVQSFLSNVILLTQHPLT